MVGVDSAGSIGCPNMVVIRIGLRRGGSVLAAAVAEGIGATVDVWDGRRGSGLCARFGAGVPSAVRPVSSRLPGSGDTESVLFMLACRPWLVGCSWFAAWGGRGGVPLLSFCGVAGG